MTAPAPAPAPETPPCRNTACPNRLRRRPNQPGWAGACGYCQGCYQRWRDLGYPDDGPGPLTAPGEHHRSWLDEQTAEREERIAVFARCRARGMTVAGAAGWAGVAPATGEKYAAELRRRAETTTEQEAGAA